MALTAADRAAVAAIRSKAAAMKHAQSHSRDIDANGNFVDHDYHYLTCVKCKLLRQADELEKQLGLAAQAAEDSVG